MVIREFCFIKLFDFKMFFVLDGRRLEVYKDFGYYEREEKGLIWKVNFIFFERRNRRVVEYRYCFFVKLL